MGGLCLNNGNCSSLAKECPLTKERPIPTFGPISCIGSKFTRMSTYPGVSFPWIIQGIFAYTDVANVVSTASYTMFTITQVVRFRVLCAVWTRLWSCWWFRCTLFCVQLFASRALSHCKHDMGALSCLNAETIERAPTPLFGRLVRCSTHGRSFGILQ